MKKIVKFLLIVLSICVVSIKAQAQSVDLGPYVPYNSIIIDGLEYYLDDDTMEAELFNRHKELYGQVVIPQYVTKKNRKYQVTKITHHVLSHLNNVTRIELPEELDELGIGTFSMCHNLTSIKMPLKLKKLGQSCFSGCNKLTEITLPEGIEDIEDNTFSGCTKLERLVIPYSVKRIRERVSGGTTLEEVVLLNPNTRIHKDAFNGSAVDKVENWNGRTCKDRWERVKIIENGVVVGYNYIQNEDED